MKKYLIILLTLLLVTPSILKAEEKLLEEKILIYNRNNNSKSTLPKNFRDLSDIGLNAIASGQFSEDELKMIKKKYPGQKFLILDLRRESHGFINGNAVSWYARFNKSNENKDVDKVVRDEKTLLKIVQDGKKVTISDIVEKDKKNGWFKKVKPEIVEAKISETESELSQKYGFEYKRIPVIDHELPSKDQLQQYIDLINNLPKDTKIYVHCAGGKGRTTTFLAIYDIIKNGKNLSFDEILARQHKAGGSDLKKTDDEEADWNSALKVKKLDLIQKFYEDNKNN